jgi:glycerate-2-kinase
VDRWAIRLAGIAAVLLVSVTTAGSEGTSPCAAACYDGHNQCRIRTKGNSATCDAQLQKCMDACRKR